MAKPPKPAPAAPANAKPPAPAKPAPAPVATPAPTVAPAPAPAPEPAAVSESPTAYFGDEKNAPLPEAATPPPPPPPLPVKAGKPTQFVRVKAGNAPVAEGGIRHDPRSEFTIPRSRLPDLADIVTHIGDIPD